MTLRKQSNDKERLDKRIAEIDHVLEDETLNHHDKRIAKTRKARLVSGIGIISVGGATEAEMHEKKDLVDDAFNACKCAVKDGIVPGGGVTLLLISRVIDEHLNEIGNVIDQDEFLGWKIVRDSLEAPIHKILDNADEKSELIIAKIMDANNNDMVNVVGYDVLTKSFENMIENGIVDPAAVVISEIKNSSSIAGLLLTTSAAIVDEPEEKKDAGIDQLAGLGM